MKKYLFNGAMALIVGAFIGSCSHDDIGQISTVDEMTKSFDEMFKELYGPIAPNHNWGFNTVAAEEGEDETTETEAAGTRTAYTNSNMWMGDGLNEPDPISDREKEVVMTWFRTHEKPQSETIDTHNYFIQNVGYTDHTYPGEGVELKDNNGNNVTITNPGRNQMDYIFVGPGYYLNEGMTKPARITWDNGDDHVNNFNAGSGDIQFIKYSGSEYFGFHDSYGTGYSTPEHGNNGKYCEKNRNFVIRYIDVDGVVGCYVGFNYESGKTSEGWHLEPDGFFDDRVIKLVAADLTPAKEESKTITTNTYRKIVDIGRVFCEDIATARMKVNEDVDYNDIVFDARVWEIYDQTTTTYNGSTTTSDKRNIKYQYDISMLATGGTIPENVGINNVDVHDAFGVGLTFMVNTWTDKSTAFGQYNTPTNVMQPKNGYETISYTLSYNQLLDKSYVGIGSIPITVKYNTQNVKAMDNKDGSAPYKLCVPIGTLWPIERVNIKEAYPGFESFVNSPSNKFYEGSQVSANLYTQAPTSRIQSDGWNIGYTQLVSSSSSTSKIYVVWEGDVTENNTAAITLYDFTFKSGQTLRFYGSGTIRVLDTSNQEVIGSIPMSGSGGYCDIRISSGQATSLNGGTIIINGSSRNFSLTKIAVL